MEDNKIFFKKSKVLTVDNFFKNVLYDKKIGYYNSKIPFGKTGDFITSPKVSYLFSEIIAIWMISCWETFGKPKNFNIVELGPGDGSLTKILLKSFRQFPEFNSIKKIFLFEESDYLRKIEKYYLLNKNFKIKEIIKKASKQNTKIIKSYKTLKNLKFIEFPQLGFKELKKITNKISQLHGCILMIDYGYYKPNNQNTLQSVMKHKKNDPLNNLGKADVTAHVNFSLLNEFFAKNGLKTKKTITQKNFLETMGILERANILSKKMKFTQQSDLYSRIQRLLSPKSMGELFKVILAYRSDNNNFAGFK